MQVSLMTADRIASRLADRCRAIRSVIDTPELASPIAEYRPGSRSNPDTGLLGWAVHYAALRKLLASTGDPSNHAAQEASLHAGSLFDAIAETPLEVRTALATTFVYPKGAHALAFLHESGKRLDAIAADNDRIAKLQPPPGFPKDIGERFIRQNNSDTVRTLNLIAWVATHRGPGLPFDSALPPIDLMPDWIYGLGMEELVTIYSACTEASAGRVSRFEPSWTLDGGAVRCPSIIGIETVSAGRSLAWTFALGHIIGDVSQPTLELVS